jgi:pyruvate formate lyase activating enzyme
MFDSRITIAGWNKLSFIDYPGLSSSVLFFAGCNLRCPYCHNPGVVLDEYDPVDPSLVMDYLEKRRDVVEGVVLSGGEPTIYDTLPAVINELHTIGFKVKLDTNGLRPAIARVCNPDYLSLDIKTLPARYHELGFKDGSAEELLLQSIELVKSLGGNAEGRITVAPGFIDDTVVEGLQVLLSGVSRVYLQPWKSGVALLDPEYRKREQYPMEKIEEYKRVLEKTVGKCVIRGY